MSPEPDPTSGFAGRIVAAFESRMTDYMEKLIARHGGRPMVASVLQEVPLENNPEALDVADRLMAGSIDMLILLTGVGTRTLINIWKTQHALETITQALAGTTLVCRGPKPIAVLKELGLKPHLTAPEPNTWREILHALDTFKPEGLSGVRIVIQEYGIVHQELANALTERGAHVRSMPVYEWALPEDVEPAKRTISRILDGYTSVVLFTSAAQAEQIMQLLAIKKERNAFRDALKKIMVASIGPMTSERLRQLKIPVDFVPSQARMGVLVKEASEHVEAILNRKR